MAQPQVEHVLEEKLNEDAEDDSEGGPENPVAHLHRQAAKIRRAKSSIGLPQDAGCSYEAAHRDSPGTRNPSLYTLKKKMF